MQPKYNVERVEAMMKLCSIFCVAVPSLPKQNINMEKHDTVGRVVIGITEPVVVTNGTSMFQEMW